jgi:hypothetical protein
MGRAWRCDGGEATAGKLNEEKRGVETPKPPLCAQNSHQRLRVRVGVIGGKINIGEPSRKLTTMAAQNAARRHRKKRAADRSKGEMSRQRKRKNPAELSLQGHRNAIGLLGFLLPVAVYLWAALRETPGLTRWHLLPSVSAYHHTGAGPLFVGVMFAIGLFLVTYRGYIGDLADRRLGKVAGLAAFVVATFPTKAPPPVPSPSWWTEWTGQLHFMAAFILLSCFALFSLWLFQRTEHEDRSQRPPMKKLRDGICLVCGVVILLAMAWAGWRGRGGDSIFCPEATAIFAFGISWLVKAEAFGLLRDRQASGLVPANVPPAAAPAAAPAAPMS